MQKLIIFGRDTGKFWLKKNMHFSQTALSHLHVRANLELSSDEEDDYSDEVK